jgi:hypothetical protein
MLPSKEITGCQTEELAPHQHCGYNSLQHFSSGFICKDVHISGHIVLMTV